MSIGRVPFSTALTGTLEDADAALTADLRAAADIDTEIGTSTQAAIDALETSLEAQVNGKEPSITAGTSAQVWQGDKTWVAKTALPISTATQTALDLKLTTTALDATLDAKPEVTDGATYYYGANDDGDLVKVPKFTFHAKEFNVVGDGTTNDTVAMQAALDFVGNLGGGEIDITDLRILIDSADLEIPAGVTLKGPYKRFGMGITRDFINASSAILLNSSYTIRLAAACSAVEGFCVFRKGLTIPTSLAEATTALAAYAGTAITLGDGTNSAASDCYVGNMLIVGFTKAVVSDYNPRPRLEHIFGDCTNGIEISRCYDLNCLQDCHFWPFLTAYQAWSFSGSDGWHRAGKAYYFNGTTGTVDWPIANNCFSYGYLTGFDIYNSDAATLVNCGVDGYAAGGLTTPVGYNIRGTSKHAALIGCKAAAQGRNYVVDNDAATMEIVVLHGCRSWGSVSYEYDFVQGSAKVVGCTAENSKAIRWQSGVTRVSFDHCYFPSCTFTGDDGLAEFVACTGHDDVRIVDSFFDFIGTVANPTLRLNHYGSGEGFEISYRKARGTPTSPATVQDGDILLDLPVSGHDGTAFRATARIRVDTVGAPSGGVVNSRWRFLLANAAGTMTDALLVTATPGGATTAAWVLTNDGSVTSLRNVVIGAADSGGTGYRLLRVAN